MAIRILFSFIAREEPALLLQCQKIRTIPLKRTEHKMVEYLEEKEMQALLDTVNINSRTGVRDKALLLLLYNTGARVSEIVELKTDNMRLLGTAQVTLMGKGKKHRTCLLWPETAQALQTYLKLRVSKDPGWVFRSNLDTDSDANWTPVPFQTGQSFQRKLSTDSDGKLTTFWLAAGMGCRFCIDGNAALENLV